MEKVLTFTYHFKLFSVCGIKDTIRYCASKILGSISAMEELKDINLHVDSKYIKAIITFLVSIFLGWG